LELLQKRYLSRSLCLRIFCTELSETLSMELPIWLGGTERLSCAPAVGSAAVS
jgi:hypothetical protein